MKLILRLLLTALAVVLLSYVLPGVNVDSMWTAIVLAVVLALLNFLVKPLLVLFTLPVTILTLGLFLLVINALIILFAENLVPGFQVAGFWWALIFSLLLSFLQAVLHSILKRD
jgi:putative membrane protein